MFGRKESISVIYAYINWQEIDSFFETASTDDCIASIAILQMLKEAIILYGVMKSGKRAWVDKQELQITLVTITVKFSTESFKQKDKFLSYVQWKEKLSIAPHLGHLQLWRFFKVGIKDWIYLHLHLWSVKFSNFSISNLTFLKKYVIIKSPLELELELN